MDKEVTIDGVNKVFIRGQKMNAALRQKVLGLAGRRQNGDGPDQGDMGLYNRALWRHNITKVEGPLFKDVAGMPLTDADLDNLPNEADSLMLKVLNDIWAVNHPPQEEADPNA